MQNLFWALAGAIALVPGSLWAQTNPLSYRPVAAEYSTALDRVVMISANPNQLHIYDTATQTDIAVTLSKVPGSVSVSPDGLYAAVGHDSLISYVNLTSGTVDKTFPLATNVQAVVLSATYVYILPTYQGNAISIEIATGASANTATPFSSGGRLHPSGKAIYWVQPGFTLDGINKYDVSAGPIGGQSGAQLAGGYPVCGTVWFSPDGSRIYSGCATIYHASIDPKLDMTYMSTMAGVTSFHSLTESAAIKRVGLIPDARPGYSSSALDDNQILVFESDYLKQTGRFLLPDFVVNGNRFEAHGKWVFFNNASTALYVVDQADGTSGLLKDFAVQKIELANPAPCSASFASATANIAATGSIATVDLSAPAACIYQAVSNVPWIKLLSGDYGSGNGTLKYIVRPNSGAAARTGTLSIGGQIFTVTQDAPSASPTSFTRLSYSVVDAEYDKALDKAILVSANPNELHIYDPVSQSDQIVQLPAPALSVSVRPDGLYAAVGHDGWVSLVNLQTAAVEQVFPVITDVHDIVLAGNGYAYLFPKNIASVKYSLQLSTGTWIVTSLGSSAYGAPNAWLHPNGNYLYAPNAKLDITQGVARPVTRPPFGIYNTCGNLWISEDGARIINACGNVDLYSDILEQDMQQFIGGFSGVSFVSWAADSTLQRSTAVIPAFYDPSLPDDTELQTYDDTRMALTSRTALPKFTIGSTSYPGHGRFVFWNRAADKLVIFFQADSSANLASDSAVMVQSPPPAGPPPCTFSLGAVSATVPLTGGFFTVALSTGYACPWTAQASAGWLMLTSGTRGIGSETIAYQVSNNFAGILRTATVTVGGQIFTVTQFGQTPAPPFGSFDTPTNNATVMGAVAVTGWALAANGVTKVDIWREPNAGEPTQSNRLVYIGDATLVPGARSDIPLAYPAMPNNSSAGWGYMLLTNLLPSNSGASGSGNGTYTLHAIAHGADGILTDLGTKTIVADNARSVRPFGTIDTPAQGATISGTRYVNFGWVLAQKAFSVPVDGSTIAVVIDGKAVGNPIYNQFRSDIANLFPGYANSGGAVGVFFIDTTKLSNGLHTIAWGVSDNAGHLEGIGSRYFTVQN